MCERKSHLFTMTSSHHLNGCFSSSLQSLLLTYDIAIDSIFKNLYNIGIALLVNAYVFSYILVVLGEYCDDLTILRAWC